MATNITPDRMRGLIVPTANITKDSIWAAQSDFTEMNPRAGVAKATQPFTGLVLEMAGEQSEQITVETVQGGLPGNGSAFKWEGEDSVEISQNANNVLTDWKNFNFITSPNEYADFDAVGSDDGTLYFVSERKNITINQYVIAVYKQTRDGAISQIATLENVTLSGAPSGTAKPAITQLKDGSLLVGYFAYTGTNQVNWVVWRSYDDGANWKKISNRALAVPLTVGSTNFDIETTNMVVVDDYVLLTMSTFSNTSSAFGNAHRQYVSRDQGTSFSLIGSGGDTYHMLSCTALPQGRAGFAYFTDTDTIAFIRIPNPGVDFGAGSYQTAKEVEVSNGVLTFCTKSTAQLSGGSLTSWYQDGVIYIVALDTNGVLYGWQSTDQGASWEYVSQSNSPSVSESVLYNPDSAVNLDRLKATVWEGRALVLCQTNRSIGGMFFGGWSTVDFPALVPQPNRNQYHGYEHNWVANQVPSTSTEYTTSGVGTHSINSDGVRITTNGNIRYYDYQGTINPTQYYHFKMKVNSGGSVANDYTAFHVTSRIATQVYTLKMRFRTTSFLIRDHATVHSSVNVDLTEFHEFMVFQDGIDVVVFYREWDETQAKKWTRIDVTLGIQFSGVPVMEWGHLVSPTLNTQSVWSMFNVSDGTIGTPGTEKRGAQYPTYGEYIYIDKGLLLTSKESPARAGDVYSIDPRADFPIDNIFHEVVLSPRVVWRSQNDTTNQNIAWYSDSVVQAAESTLGLSDVIGFHLSGINWKRASIEVWNGASWDTVANIDTSTNMNGKFRRYGATLVPNSNAREFSLNYDEARGWYAELNDGVNKYIVKIKQNSEGIWTTSLGKSPVLMIDTEYTDPTTLPIDGTIAMMPTSISMVSELFQGLSGPGASAYRLAIPSQDTLEGYFQIGTMIIGNVYFMAPQYQRGRSISYSPNIQSTETLDNMFYSRKLSQGARTFQIAWTEPVDTRTIMELNPDYWQFSTTAGAVPVANYGDAPFGMMGLFQYLSNQVPIVYLPAITKSTSTATDIQLFNRFHDHSLVRTTGELTIESVIGEESQDEMFRVANINLQEIE